MFPHFRNAGRLQCHQGGFSLIEVLVTLFVISLALLGTAGLQAYSMRLNQSGQFRTQAVFLVADLAERMEANKPAAVLGQYAVPTSDTANTINTTCGTGTCDPKDLADYDLSQWQNAVAQTLPQATWTVTNNLVGGVIPNPVTYTVVVTWVDRRENVDEGASGAAETFTYTATRTIFN